MALPGQPSLDFTRSVWRIGGAMKTVGEFITESSARLAPFERGRIGRLGCALSLVAMVAALGLLIAGVRESGGWMAGFRFVILCGLGAVLAAFALIALAETIVERSVRAGVAAYLREGGTDAETLLKSAEMRQSQVRGGARFVALVKEYFAGS